MKNLKAIIKKILFRMQKFLDFGFFIFILLYFFTLIFFHSTLVDVFGYEFDIVQSKSMTGVLNKYDLVFVSGVDISSIKEGDIIVFFDDTGKYKVIHRVTEIVSENGELLFKTKGDFNPAADNGYRKESQIYAKYSFKIPYVGIVITFLSSSSGLAVIFVNIWNFLLISLIWNFDEEKNLMTDFKILSSNLKKQFK